MTTRLLRAAALCALLIFSLTNARAQSREPRRLFLVEGERGARSYIDRTGRVLLSFPDGLDFSESVGRGQLRWPGRYETDDDGTGRVFGRPYRTRVGLGEFSDGMARFSFDLRPGSRALFVAYGFIDETGKVVIPPLYQMIDDFREGRAMFQNREGKRGYIDKTGKVVVEPVYQLTWGFSEGLAAACLENNVTDSKCGYIDRDGRVVHPFTLYAAMHFSGGLALVGLDGERTAYVDKSMRVRFRMKEGEYGGQFSEGLATIRMGLRGKFGYLDTSGRVVIPAGYDDAREFSEGLALVSKEGHYGFIDKTGKVRIPLQYFYGSSFSEGLAAVTTSGDWQVPGWGYIDREGRVRVPLKFDYAAPFSGGLAAIDRVTDRQNITDAYIDPEGRFVWEKPKR